MTAAAVRTDAILWALARGGDAAAFGELFDRHRDRVFRSAVRSLDVQEAEDAVAVTFLELWRRREAVRLVDGSLQPWLLATSHNVARNLARGRRRYRAFLARIPLDEAARSPEDITLDEAEEFERRRAAAAVLAALPHADAELLTLVTIEELSVAEVAKLLGISTDAAKQRISRARRRARGLAVTHGQEAAEGAKP
jgi:RNA polymerase sigma-70 factor (ECF subfamily)